MFGERQSIVQVFFEEKRQPKNNKTSKYRLSNKKQKVPLNMLYKN